MTPQELKALERIGLSTSQDDLRKIAKNALGKSPVVEQAALRRLVAIQVDGKLDAVSRDCWVMVLAVEAVRHQVRGRKAPMNRLRPKIANEGERAALEYLALHESDGFSEVLEYGMPEYSAEAIVIRHGEPTFSAKAIRAARTRLEKTGLDPDDLARMEINL